MEVDIQKKSVISHPVLMTYKNNTAFVSRSALTFMSEFRGQSEASFWHCLWSWL